MRKHASLDELALLDADALKPRKAAKVRSHLAHCGECSQHHAALGTVPTMLASVPYESMPDNLSSRLDSALAAESAQRQASQPGTEANRGMLPERSRRSGIFTGAGSGLRMPRLSGPAVRALATAGAVVVVVGGGIGVATQFGGVSSSSGQASRAAIRQAPRAAALPSIARGAAVRYGDGRRVQEITSGTNFIRANIPAQVTAAIRAEKRKGFDMSSVQGAANSPGSHAVPTSSMATAAGGLSGSASSGSPPPSAGQLAACLNGLVPGQKVQLLEHAKFESKPATIIVTAAPLGHPEHVFVVGDACSATNSDVLFRGTVPNSA
jgi:hypothetical protein